jgi:hypothetical protein
VDASYGLAVKVFLFEASYTVLHCRYVDSNIVKVIFHVSGNGELTDPGH